MSSQYQKSYRISYQYFISQPISIYKTVSKSQLHLTLNVFPNIFIPNIFVPNIFIPNIFIPNIFIPNIFPKNISKQPCFLPKHFTKTFSPKFFISQISFDVIYLFKTSKYSHSPTYKT